MEKIAKKLELNKENYQEIGNYFVQKGHLQKEYDKLHKELVPSKGKASTDAGELLRNISNLYYEYMNNGNCNAILEWEHYIDDGEDDDNYEYEYEWREDYGNYMEFIQENCKPAAKNINLLYDMVLESKINYETGFDKKLDVIYNLLIDTIVEYIINEKSSIINKN